MSTRSFIGIKMDENVIIGVYNHHDGYPSYTGRILKENYNTEKKVWKLISKGDLSLVTPKIEDVIVISDDYYAPRYRENEDEIFDNTWYDYAYIFDTNDWCWYYTSEKSRKFEFLTDEIIEND